MIGPLSTSHKAKGLIPSTMGFMVRNRHLQVSSGVPGVCLFLFLMALPCIGSWASEHDYSADRQHEFAGPGSGLVWHRGQVVASFGRAEQQKSPKTHTAEFESQEQHARSSDGSIPRRAGNFVEDVSCMGLCQYVVRVDSRGGSYEDAHARILEAAAGRFVKYVQVKKMLPRSCMERTKTMVLY